MGKARVLASLVMAVTPLLAACGDDSAGSTVGAADPFGNAGRMSGDPGSGASGSGGVPPDGSEGEFPGACPDGLARTSRVVPRVILVLDGSCSMSTEYGAGGPSATTCSESASSRWGALRSALLDPQNGVVSRLAGVIEFGLVIFGTRGSCPIPGEPIQPGVNNGEAIENAFPDAPPGMFTPTGLALQWVYDNMISSETLDSDLGPQIVLLATDGEPNSCEDAEPNYQPSVDAVTYGQSIGATTYVVSLANATGEFHDHLQELANIGSGGGQATLYEPTTPEQLANQLESLIGGAVGCDVALNGMLSADRACSGTVELNGNRLECGVEWELADPRHIRLLEPACSQFQSSASAVLRADFPCDVFRPD